MKLKSVLVDENTFSKILASGYEGKIMFADSAEESFIGIDLFAIKQQIENHREKGEEN